jgi:hypothetical protein
MITHLIKRISILILFISILSGCEERILDPFEMEDSEFSVYGALSLDESPNYIRIRDLTTPFLSEPLSDLNMLVTFEDLANDSITELRDTVVNFSGNYTHNFIVEHELAPGSTYLLKVEREGSEPVISSVTTPRITEVEIDQGFEARCGEFLDIRFNNVAYPEMIDMDIVVYQNNTTHRARLLEMASIEHVPGRDQMHVQLTPRMLLVQVFPMPGANNPFANPTFAQPEFDCNELDQPVIELHYTHFGPDWSEEAPFLGVVRPAESINIEGGLGALGAIRKDSFSITLQN